jgi:hypothetical protein
MDPKKEVLDLFLCHNRSDKDWVRKLAEQVESETFDGLPNGRQRRVFFDEWDIDTGQNILVGINAGLSAARYFGVIISPEFLAAPWTTLEWTHVVCDDPTNRKGRLIPIFLRDYSEVMQSSAEMPAPLKALNWLDFRRPGEFTKSFQKLIRKLRDQSPARGARRKPLAALGPLATPIPSPVNDASAAPDRVDEAILGNLLPVESYPNTIWSAPTDLRKNKDVWVQVPEAPAFELQEKRLYAFTDLSAPTNLLRPVIDTGGIQSHAVGSWMNDSVKWRWFTSLLNKSLNKHFRGLPIYRDDRGRYFFSPNKDGTAREWQNGRDPVRVVAAKKSRDDGTNPFWVHQAARLCFQTLGDRLFLMIEPSYVFSVDGRKPLQGKLVGPLSMKWSGKERNAAILRHIMFWSRTLAKWQTKIEIATGAAPIVLSGVPAVARTSVGINDDRVGIGSLLAQVEDELALAAAEVSDEFLETGTGEEGTDDD